MARKKAEAVQVPDNLSMAFLQRRFEMLMKDMDAMRARGVVEVPRTTPTPEESQLQSELDLAQDLLAQAEEDRATLREQVKSLTSEKKDLEERLRKRGSSQCGA